ncbi:sensor histidine kinase [Actinoplanes solisilvae]|uniref:sensor histidine kinase n=1 Tax=Actinoplanes solisilvae TaxID=2486853 RepID=UPI001F0BA39E|nr:histidine kinase [Actinoplanes solisilvae]
MRMGARGRVAIDVAVALAAGVFTVGMLRQGGLGAAEPGYHTLDAAGVALAALTVAPLPFARRFPGWAWAVSAIATLVILGLDYGLDVPPGALIATYVLADSVGGDDDPPRRRPAAAAGVAAFLPVAIGLMIVQREAGLEMWSGLFAWAAMFALVWTAGDRSRLRRDRISQLEVSARLRELDLQGQRRLAIAEVRTRIARELHDSAGHAINVILVQAGAARLLHKQDPERSMRAIATVEQVAYATIADIDRLVRGLRQGSDTGGPAPNDTGDLEDLVSQHRAGGLDVRADVDGAPRGLSSGVAWAAYRILQEALTNAARHGSGSADVRMSYGPDAVDIEVSNPVGVRQRPGGGLGIIGMRERAALLDGVLEAGPDADGEFRLRARLPYVAPIGSLA